MSSVDAILFEGGVTVRYTYNMIMYSVHDGDGSLLNQNIVLFMPIPYYLLAALHS